jgi:hypothetical protein
MKSTLFEVTMRILYAAGIVFVLAVLVTGLPYYTLLLTERPHSGMHEQLKPGGIWGHGLGIVGSAMVLLLLLYSLRKRRGFGLRVGPLRRWLDVHILFGIMGPLLITLHTAMKFHGIVSISYFSMIAVALSGVFGRYVYMQIPRDSRGNEMSLQNAKKRVADIQRAIAEEYELPADAARTVREFAIMEKPGGSSKFLDFVSTIHLDFTLRRRSRRLRQQLKRSDRSLPPNLVDEVTALAREASVLQRRIVFLNSMNELFHYWHVFHKPFAYVMLTIMVLHVGVTVAFGYRWIF